MSNLLSEESAAKVQDILMDKLGIERAQVTPEAEIMADLGADSLAMVEIGMTVEETFKVSIPDEEMDKIHTVADLHEVLATLLERTGQAV